MYNIEDIRTIHLEITQKCQAACPMCDRNQNGGALNPHISLDELSLQDCKDIFSPSFIKQLNKMYMCGNLGDPVIAEDTLEVFEYFRQHNSNIWLNMHTNGGAKKPQWWNDLAKVIGKVGDVTFSVDGLKDTNHLYRQNVNWDIVDQSMKAYIQGGGKARWDYLIFEHNQHQVEEAEQYAKSIGVYKFQSKKTGRFITQDSKKKESHQAVNRKGKETQELKKPDKKYQNKALSKQGMLLEKYGTMDKYYDQVKVLCKVAKENSLYVSAEGLALPCCWTAGRMYKWWHKDPKIEQIWNYIDMVGGKESLDAKKGLEEVFKTGIFDKIADSWNIQGTDNGKLKVCAMKCGEEFDPFAAQFSK
tara:strand:+ start:13589 stop:14668 length:1080 start_codon:yes stop_codon:yes gene_type:complete